MRLCHVSAGYYPFVGGAQTYLQTISERCARAGHDVSVFTTNAAQVDCFWKPDAPRVDPGAEQLNGVRVQRCALGYVPGAPLSFYLLRRAAPILSHLPLVSRAVLNALAPWMPRVPALALACLVLLTAWLATGTALEGSHNWLRTIWLSALMGPFGCAASEASVRACWGMLRPARACQGTRQRPA